MYIFIKILRFMWNPKFVKLPLELVIYFEEEKESKVVTVTTTLTNKIFYASLNQTKSRGPDDTRAQNRITH